MENRKGSGIFLGVVSIATLIVAIIGATFAYFSATVSGAGNVNVTSYEIAASMVITEETTDGGLIPLNKTDIASALAVSTTADHEHDVCKDEAGKTVCKIYKVVITNDSTTELKLTGSILQDSNSGFASLYMKEVDFVSDDAGYTDGSYNENLISQTGTATAIDLRGTETSDENKVYTVDAKSGDTSGSLTLYFMLYIENSADTDQSDEMGQTYEGTISFSTESGSSKLSGTFSA